MKNFDLGFQGIIYDNIYESFGCFIDDILKADKFLKAEKMLKLVDELSWKYDPQIIKHIKRYLLRYKYQFYYREIAELTGNVNPSCTSNSLRQMNILIEQNYKGINKDIQSIKDKL